MESLHYLLMKTHTRLNRRIMSEAAAMGLSPGQPKVLECLMRNGESNQKAIADYCEIEQATAGSILTRMERDGLISRTQRAGNRRSLYVSLTPQGKALGQRMEEVFRRADALAVSCLTQGQQAELLALLKMVCASEAEQEGDLEK